MVHNNAFLTALLLLLLFGGGIIPNTRAQEQDQRPKYEHLFNCRCDDECGFALKDCTCPFSDKMREDLREMDQQGLSQKKQIERMKDEYGSLVLSVPEKEGSDLVLYYFFPPVILFLGLFFVGGLGWYWRYG